jgi:hypothetical protein
MAFVSSPDRFLVTDGSGNSKLDTSNKYPVIHSNISGSITPISITSGSSYSSAIVTDTYYFPSREGGGYGTSGAAETRYVTPSIESVQTLWTAPAGVYIDTVLAKIKPTSISSPTPPTAYSPGATTAKNTLRSTLFTYSLSVGTWYSTNGSLLVEMLIAQNGKIQRSATCSIFVDDTRTRVNFYFKRSGFNDDASGSVYFAFDYQAYIMRII